MVYGPSEVTQGAAGDLEMVTRICREMVTRYGFSSLGPVALEGEGAEWGGKALQGPLSAAAGQSQFIRSLGELAADQGRRDDAGARASGVGRMERWFGGWVRVAAAVRADCGECHVRLARREPAGELLREERQLMEEESDHGWAEWRLLRTAAMALSRVASSDAGSGISILETMQW